ncbi:solute carrier family 35 member G1-like [Ptychodera flava]|uniref:solute carrier family 35 member G1-like n=1 Tax=Ptychodera flava TaxID=63121 RepID=UPI00396A9746
MGCELDFRSGLGVLISLATGVGSSLSNLCIVLTQYGGASQFQVGFIIAFGGLIALVIILLCKGIGLLPDLWKDRIIVLANGVIYTLCGIALFYALPRAPLGNVITIVAAGQPIFTPIFACVLLRERWRLIDIVATVLDIIAVLLIAQPAFLFGESTNTTPEEAVAYTLAFVASLGLSLCFVLGRLVGQRVHPFVTTLYLNLVSSISNGILMFAISKPSWDFDYTVWLELLAVCLLGNLNEVGRYAALKLEFAPTVVLVQNIHIAITYILEVTVLNEKATTLDIVGATIVLSSSMMVAIVTWWQNTRTKRRLDEEAELQSLVSKDN